MLDIFDTVQSGFVPLKKEVDLDGCLLYLAFLAAKTEAESWPSLLLFISG